MAQSSAKVLGRSWEQLRAEMLVIVAIMGFGFWCYVFWMVVRNKHAESKPVTASETMHFTYPPGTRVDTIGDIKVITVPARDLLNQSDSGNPPHELELIPAPLADGSTLLYMRVYGKEYRTLYPVALVRTSAETGAKAVEVYLDDKKRDVFDNRGAPPRVREGGY